MAEEKGRANAPGIKTTEFWITLAVVVAGHLYAAGVISEGSQVDGWIGLAGAVLAALGYTGFKTLLKRKTG